jgi:hypothetical protein
VLAVGAHPSHCTAATYCCQCPLSASLLTPLFVVAHHSLSPPLTVAHHSLSPVRACRFCGTTGLTSPWPPGSSCVRRCFVSLHSHYSARRLQQVLLLLLLLVRLVRLLLLRRLLLP